MFLIEPLAKNTGNSESLGTYWRTWNKPVYQFFRRHVYSPMRSRGWGHLMASTTVFLLSAILHELMVGVPTHNLIGELFSSHFITLFFFKKSSFPNEVLLSYCKTN